MQHHHASHCPLTSCFCFWMSLDSPGGEEPHDRCQKPCLQSNLQAGVESYWGYRTGPERRPWGSPWSTIDVDFNLIRIYRCFWAWSLFTTQKDTFGKFTTIQNLIHWTDLQWLGFRASNNKIQISVEKVSSLHAASHAVPSMSGASGTPYPGILEIKAESKYQQ